MRHASRRDVMLGAAAAPVAWRASAVRADEAKLRIAMITQLSGYAQAYGTAYQAGAAIAVDRINQTGGVGGRQIEFVARDDHGRTDDAVVAFRELYADGTRLFIGGPISGPSVAVGALMGNTEGLFIGAGANLVMSHENYNRNVFRGQISNVAAYTGMGKIIAQQNPGVLKWAIIGNDQQVAGDTIKIFSNAIRKYYGELHNARVTILDPILTKAGSGDFRTQLAELAASGAEGIFNGLVGSDALTYYKQARAYNLDKTIKVFAENSAELQIVKALGSSIPGSIWSVTAWYFDPTQNNPVSKYLHDEYAKRHPEDRFPFGFVGNGHDAVLLFADAVRNAGSLNTDAVRQALVSGTTLGAMGALAYRPADHALLGDLTYLHFGATSDDPAGWTVFDVARIPSAGLTEPPTPGEPFVIHAAGP